VPDFRPAVVEKSADRTNEIRGLLYRPSRRKIVLQLTIDNQKELVAQLLATKCARSILYCGRLIDGMSLVTSRMSLKSSWRLDGRRAR